MAKLREEAAAAESRLHELALRGALADDAIRRVLPGRGGASAVAAGAQRLADEVTVRDKVLDREKRREKELRAQAGGNKAQLEALRDLARLLDAKLQAQRRGAAAPAGVEASSSSAGNVLVL